MLSYALFAAGYLFLAPPSCIQEQEPKSGYLLRTYALKDITFQLARRETPGPTDPRVEIAQLSSERKEQMRRIGEELADLIRTFLSPRLEADAAQQKVEVGGTGSVLLFRGTQEQQHWVTQYLMFHREQEQLLEIETRVLVVAEDALASLGLGEDPLVLATAETERAFFEKAKSTAGVDVITAPRVKVWNGQRANLSMLNQTAYIERYDVLELVEPGRQRVIDPVVEVVNDGIVWDLRAAVLPGGTIGIDSKLAISELVRPMEERKTEHGLVGIPELKTTRVQSAVRVTPGQCFVLTAHPHDGKRLVLMLKASMVDAGEVPPTAEAPTERKR